MTNFNQFSSQAKMRHDYSDMIQVRYTHPNGEDFDAWVSGEEVMQRLDTQARERLIKSFSQKDWDETKQSAQKEVEKSKNKARRFLKNRLADIVSDQIGDNIIGDTLADNVRDVDSNLDAYDQEKAVWQNRLQDDSFRKIVLELAWIVLSGTMPEENNDQSLDDWV